MSIEVDADVTGPSLLVRLMRSVTAVTGALIGATAAASYLLGAAPGESPALGSAGPGGSRQELIVDVGSPVRFVAGR